MNESMWGRGAVCARRILAAAITCAVAAGCSDLFGPDGPKVTVSLELERPLAPAPALGALIGGRGTLVPASPTGTMRAERSVRGPRFGTLPVQVALLGADGDTLAAVAFSQEFRRGDSNGIAARVGVRRPVGTCIGTLAVAPLRAGGGDTLFVAYGGIPEGAIC
jgi:hypothetical protein